MVTAARVAYRFFKWDRPPVFIFYTDVYAGTQLGKGSQGCVHSFKWRDPLTT